MNDKVKGKVEGTGDDALNQNERILARMRSVAGVETDAALAGILGIKPQNITQAKKRGIPNPWLVKISQQYNYDINNLLSVREYNETAGTERSYKDGIYEDLPSDGPKFGEMSSDEWDILGKAYRVITSQSNYKQILIQNINAFHDALISEQENKTLKARIQILNKVNKGNSSEGIEEEDGNRSAI